MFPHLIRRNDNKPCTRMSAHNTTATTRPKPLEPCVICLEPISERAITAPCNHATFDFLCLVSWLQEHPQCPLCKTEVKRVDYAFASAEEYLSYYVPAKPREATSASSSSSTYSAPAWGRPHSQLPRRPRPIRRQIHPPSPDAALLRRRHVYRNKLYSLHVGSNRLSQFKDFTPITFSKSLELEARARKWIRRELQVFDFLSADTPASGGQHQRRVENAEFLLLYIISILKTVDIKGSSGKAQELLSSYLGEENARLFLHELEAWLRSPYVNLHDWDAHVQYATPLPNFPESRGNHGKDHEERASLSESGPRRARRGGYQPD